MVTAIIIPIIVVAIVGITGFALYRFVIYDFICNKTVNKTLQKYNIKKTQSEIIKEYHQSKGETISEKEVSHLEKHYRQHEPEQFLAMYDAVRKKSNTDNSS